MLCRFSYWSPVVQLKSAQKFYVWEDLAVDYDNKLVIRFGHELVEM